MKLRGANLINTAALDSMYLAPKARDVRAWVNGPG